MLLGIPRRSIYSKPTKQKKKDNLLKEKILELLKKNPSYGHRRVAIALGVSKKRARRVMKLFAIRPYKRIARWTKKKDWNQLDSRYPNLVEDICPIRPKVVFAGDFTRLLWYGKIFYLATFIDIFTREVVGWSISIRHTKDFVLEAFLDAIRTAGKPLIVHTDQGSEYNSQEYTDFMKGLGVKISMNHKASPWENAYQESFYDNFKTDLGLEFERFETLGEFIEAVHKTINYYNNERIHTKLKMSPSEFKAKFLNLTV